MSIIAGYARGQERLRGDYKRGTRKVVTRMDRIEPNEADEFVDTLERPVPRHF